MDLALTILYLKFSKRKLLHKILKFQSLLMGQAGPSPIFTFKFSFLYNANYKLEALSIWWDILIENYCFLIPLVKSLIVIFIM